MAGRHAEHSRSEAANGQHDPRTFLTRPRSIESVRQSADAMAELGMTLADMRPPVQASRSLPDISDHVTDAIEVCANTLAQSAMIVELFR